MLIFTCTYLTSRFFQHLVSRTTTSQSTTVHADMSSESPDFLFSKAPKWQCPSATVCSAIAAKLWITTALAELGSRTCLVPLE